MMRLKAPQERAKNQIVADAVSHLSSGINEPVRIYGFTGTTGCGKTITTASSIKEINHQLNGNVLVIMLTLSEGGLHSQTRNKVQGYLSNSGIKIKSVIDACRDKECANVLIIDGWTSLNQTDRKTGKPTNVAMRPSESGLNFPQLCALAREQNIPIMLIVDEFHDTAHTLSSDNIISLIKPNYILEVSATPSKHQAKWGGFARITYADAKRCRLVKADIRLSEFQSNEHGIEIGIAKVQELLRLALLTNVPYTPRMIVFAPNGEAGIAEVLAWAQKYAGWTVGNKDIAIWTEGNKQNTDICQDYISPVKMIITKEALGTGIDIPPAQVGIQLRPIVSKPAKVQKLGRCIRMPEQKHYGNDLDVLFYYVAKGTDLDFADADFMEDEKNKKHSHIKQEHIHHIEALGKIPATYYERIPLLREEDKETFAEVFKPLLLKRLNDHSDISFVFDRFEEELRVDMSLDLDSKAPSGGNIVQKSINKDPEKLLIPRMRTALPRLFKHSDIIDDCIGTYFDDHSIENTTIRRQFFTLNNFSRIMQWVSEASDEAEKNFGAKRQPASFDYEIPREYRVRGEVGIEYRKYLHHRYIQTADRSDNESRFERYIDAHALVNGWLKNYRNQYRTSFSAPYLSNYTDEVVHFPDYLIATTDGRYLFVEVKSDISSIDRNQNEKSNAIKDALSGTKAIGIMVFGRDDRFYFKTENGVEAFEVLLKSDFKSDLLDSNLEKAFVDGNETVFDLMDRLSSKK